MTENKIKPTMEQTIYCLKAESERYPEVCEECQLYGEVGCDHCYDDTNDMAIKFLKELEQYRAIGTVENFKALKEKSESNEVREILIDFLIHQTLIERSNILTEKEKSELYNKACELGCEKLKDNSKPFFENWRSVQKTPTPNHPIPIDTQQYIEELECKANAYGRGYNQGTIDRAEELQKCREYGYNKAIDECIKIIEETTWKDTDMLVESIRELKGGAEC